MSITAFGLVLMRLSLCYALLKPFSGLNIIKSKYNRRRENMKKTEKPDHIKAMEYIKASKQLRCP